VPFDLVPGVSSLTAGPALAGIPVTHRGLATAVLFVTGHDAEAFSTTVRGLRGTATTLVVAMGYAKRAALAGVLIGAGWRAATPCAVVAGASLPGQQIWRGPLADLAAGDGMVEGDQPALLVVGDVAGLALTEAAVTAGASDAEAPSARRRSIGATTDPRGTR
jgi:siroheme synthase